MQNSLERVFEGLERALREIVAPAVSDPYVLSQVMSVAEIIANLSTRVEWKCEQLLEVCMQVRPVLEHAAGSTGLALPLTRRLLSSPAPDASWTNRSLLDSRDEHLRALVEVQRSVDATTDESVERSIREFLGWQVAAERRLLRTGMFSRSGR